MHNVSAGVVLSNVSLVLRSVTHARAGSYACSAANTRGETTSHPPLQLRVQCEYYRAGCVQRKNIPQTAMIKERETLFEIAMLIDLFPIDYQSQRRSILCVNF